MRATNYLDFSQQVFLQLAPISFDAATFEIWGSLLNGAKLVLFPGDKPSLAELGQIIQKQQITTLWLTAGLFHLMVDERLADLQPIRQSIAGGDVLSVPHVQKVLANLPNCQLINGYGPTENTTFTCCYPIVKTDTLLTSIPIGRPISTTQVYILDAYLQPVPIGIPGQLYIGGDGLARGYLDRPQLTAEKFIPNPFSSGKLYQTGDLARYLPDGNIEFLGRIDNQVKIRGFRIELELQLTEIWGRLLGVRSIGIRDNFFELGGHSLIAVRLFSEIEQTWGQNLPLATLFQKQTIQELADVLRQEEWSAPWSSLVSIKSGGNKPPL